MIKIASLVGARPQIIKAAALSRAVKQSFANKITEHVVHSGQHYDALLSDVFIQQLELAEPFLNLNVGSDTPSRQISAIINGFEEYLLSEKPDLVILYGDTNTTLAGTIAASNLKIPIAHVEAGLRSYNKSMPEEINRVICDMCSTLLFTPNDKAISNLQKEGIDSGELKSASIDTPYISNVGDIMIDNLKWLESKGVLKENVLSHHQPGYAVVTIHRQENTENLCNLRSILSSFPQICEQYKLQLKFMVHPRTELRLINDLPEVKEQLDGHPMIDLMLPQNYLSMMDLLKNSELVITDSGGLQKEAYYFKKPLLILRNETEWTEIVEGGYGILGGMSQEGIMKSLDGLNKQNPKEYIPFYGNGQTSESILEIILEHFS